MNRDAYTLPAVITPKAHTAQHVSGPESGRHRSLRVLALVTGLFDTTPAQRFRIEQWAPGLRAMGVQLEFEPFMSPELQAMLYQSGKFGAKSGLMFEALIRRAKALRHVKEFDLVYVLRETALLGPALFERWLRFERVPYVFDFDDAIFLPNASEANRVFRSLKFPSKTATACRLSAHVMAGNEYLAVYARRFNEHVTVVPTTIDTETYRPMVRPRGSLPVVGWSGSRTTGKHLELAVGALRELARRRRFRLRAIGIDSLEIEGLECEALRWKPESEVRDLQAFDIGIMPLPEDEWARGKCGLKALQYMALGIPTVCSPVGMNTQLIRDGKNGLFASSEEEWVEKLTLLIESEDLRRRLGRSGRETVEAWYSAKVQVPRIAKLFGAATLRTHTV